MIQALILAVVVLVLALFVVRPLLSPQKSQGADGLAPLSLGGPDTMGGMDAMEANGMDMGMGMGQARFRLSLQTRRSILLPR